jgi:hypothetical protein
MLLSESLRTFLVAQTTKQITNDLLDRVLARLPSLEVQINVAQGDGEPVAGKRNTYSNGVYEWFGMRIPHHADSTPTWNDFEIHWPLDLHADAIGSTGWDWREGASWWAGYDIDSKQGHAGGLDDATLQTVVEAASRVPYIEIRRSSSGRGIHLYVGFDGIPTANHTIHAVLARAVLAKMSQDAGFDFAPYIDVCGGNMWVWRRNQTDASFALIKEGIGLLSETGDPSHQVPKDWRDHLPKPDKVPSTCTSKVTSLLSEAQKQFVDTVAASRYSTIWQAEKGCLHTHTCAIKAAHAELKLRGVFETNSAGDHQDCNCFCYPLEDDAWRVVRFSQGIPEAPTWTQDGTGWTWCDVNKAVDLGSAAGVYNGVELPRSGGYVFEDAAEAAQALAAMGYALEIPFPDRRIKLITQKDGRPVVAMERRQDDETPFGWIAEKRGWFERVVGEKPEQQQTNILDRYRRVFPDDSKKYKSDIWYLHHLGWDLTDRSTAHDHIAKLLASPAAANDILGQLADTPWYFVDIPFGPEYPGNNKWNLHAAQLRVQPTTKTPCHPTWDMTLSHTFSGLDNAIGMDPWCQQYGVHTGRDYAILWVASMIRKPFDRTPYLFLVGDEDCGKSTFHESLTHIISPNGIMNATSMIGGKDMFTGPLRHAVLAYIEEKSFAGLKTAAEIMKTWTGNELIDIRAMRRETIRIRNKLHLVHVANEAAAAPFSGSNDTRITMTFVPPLTQYIARAELHARLQAEAPHFVRTLLEIPLPPTDRSRFCLPMIDTEHKLGLRATQQSPVVRFINEFCERATESQVPSAEFCNRYRTWTRDLSDFDGNGTDRQILGDIPVQFPITLVDNVQYITRLAWKKPCTDH